MENYVAYFNRLTSDGEIFQFRKDGTQVGHIGAYTNGLYIGGLDNNDASVRFGNAFIAPANSNGSNRDNVIDLGASSARFDDIFATNSTIQTSDQNEKQSIQSLTATEIAVRKKNI